MHPYYNCHICRRVMIDSQNDAIIPCGKNYLDCGLYHVGRHSIVLAPELSEEFKTSFRALGFPK
jgi:hypothetical protein